jgi:signal transduction histidine kinase/ActR/RegA family two-component response regulator
MQGSHVSPAAPAEDRSRVALDFVQGLLLAPADDARTLGPLLADLARAFAAGAAGLAAWSGGEPPEPRAQGGEVPPGRWPWEEQPDWLDRLRGTAGALAARTAGGASWLAATVGSPDRPAWLLWLRAEGERAWTDADGAALVLAGQALRRRALAADGPAWARQLGPACRQLALEEFAGVVRRLAHDFGNLFTSILGFTELTLSQMSKGAPVHGYLAEAHRATQQGAALIGQLRLFSRRGPVPPLATSLALVATAEAERLRAEWGPGVELQLRLPPDLPPVQIDPDMLRQLLTPVLENAREAAGAAGTVTVSAAPAALAPADCLGLFGSPVPGPCVAVTVTDTGSGLAAEAAGRLFAQPFFSTKPRHRGLGLATAHGILAAHRGGLRLGPGPGGGTAVDLFLPAAAAPAETGALDPSAPARGERVLVVDDDPAVLRMVCTTLERAGYRVRSASGGDEALQAYTAPGGEPFQLVLSDVLMPRMSGVDLARSLLHHDARANVLFMSGHVSPDFARENLGSGQFDLLPKPFRAEGLLQAVRAALDREERRPAAAGAGR